MHSQGGGIAVLATAPERVRNRDNHYTFRHDSDFYYLTGFTEANAWLVLIAGQEDRSMLFCEGKHPERELWDGVRWGPQAAAEHFGFDQAQDVSELDLSLPSLLVGTPRMFTILSGPNSPELLTRIQNWSAAARATVRGSRAVPHQWTDLSEVIAEMRLIKDAAELHTMRAAAAISAQGHVRAMQVAQPGRHEY